MKDYIKVFDKAVKWIENNSVVQGGIRVHSGEEEMYPEVTGYYIPTLINWGYKDLAEKYAEWLCSIQKEDGSWFAPDDSAPYVFDSAQVLKGLIAIEEYMPSVKDNILRGCDWIMSNVNEQGRLITPTKDAWGDGTVCSELVHIYCLEPLIKAGKIFERVEYEEKAKKILDYYIKNHLNEIENFNILSHFYAYIVESLVDLKKIELAQKCMSRIEKLQRRDGSVPAYKNVNWVCSTGLFQFAVIWY